MNVGFDGVAAKPAFSQADQPVLGVQTHPDQRGPSLRTQGINALDLHGDSWRLSVVWKAGVESAGRAGGPSVPSLSRGVGQQADQLRQQSFAVALGHDIGIQLMDGLAHLA